MSRPVYVDFLCSASIQHKKDVYKRQVLFHGTIRENLKWGNPDATEEDLNRAITVAQAKEFVDNKEGGLDFEIEQGGKNLSGGQRQRLTLSLIHI